MSQPLRRVWMFRSDSDPSREYQTLQYADGTTSCQCPGWTRRVAADGSRSCKHTRWVDPDGALDHGNEVSNVAQDFHEIRQIEPRLLAPHYVESGWPVILAPVAAEAWRRYEAGELADGEFYCSEAVIAGLCFYNPSLADRVRIERERIIDTPSAEDTKECGE